MPICGVSLTLRRCDVHPSTSHFSEFREPGIWAFLSNLPRMTPSANCQALAKFYCRAVRTFLS